jgi:CDP-diacylglycerol---glycerol-3-phosphate 3-phosphatidyltransferase
LSIYALKPRFQALLRPLAAALARSGVTANQVTIAGVAISIAVGAFVAWRAPERTPFLLIPIWMFVRMALNALDGMLARDFNQESRLGAYLNELGDVVSDAALYAPFAWLPPFSGAWLAAVIVLAIVAEFAGIMGTTVGASRRFDGPFGKSDRAFAFGALGLWIGLGGILPDWIAMALPLFAALLAVTVANRVQSALAEAKENMR